MASPRKSARPSPSSLGVWVSPTLSSVIALRVWAWFGALRLLSGKLVKKEKWCKNSWVAAPLPPYPRLFRPTPRPSGDCYTACNTVRERVFYPELLPAPLLLAPNPLAHHLTPRRCELDASLTLLF